MNSEGSPVVFKTSVESGTDFKWETEVGHVWRVVDSKTKQVLGYLDGVPMPNQDVILTIEKVRRGGKSHKISKSKAKVQNKITPHEKKTQQEKRAYKNKSALLDKISDDDCDEEQTEIIDSVDRTGENMSD